MCRFFVGLSSKIVRKRTVFSGGIDVRSGTGDLLNVLDGGARKKSKKIIVAAIPISSTILAYAHDRAHFVTFFLS
jgi:hypothetical protein